MRSWSEYSNREKVMIIVLGVLAVSLSFYFFLYKPRVDKVKDINNDLERTISDIKGHKDVLRRKEELKREYKTKLAQLQQDDQDRPIKLSQKSDLIVRINELIDKTGVSLKTIQSTKNQKTKSQKYGYTKMPINIEISGDYNSILNFVNQVEELKYLIKVNTLNLSSNSNSGLDTNAEVKINARVNLVAFATDDVKGR